MYRKIEDFAMNMTKWVEKMIEQEAKRPMPILTFPSVQLLYITTRELVAGSSYQATGMKLIASRYDTPVSFGYMDLSVEAEAFGAHCVYSAHEVPTIIGRRVTSRRDADDLNVPKFGAGRTEVTVEAIRRAKGLITDRPVIAQCSGPFSLAGRLMNVNDIMLQCYEEPELVQVVLRKATDFIIKYAGEFKKAGADGIMIAEPLAGLLSPWLVDEFSTNYVREIVEAVQDDSFITFYHNCGNAVPHLLDSIISTGSRAFHFGDAVKMKDILEKIPSNRLVLGNLSPARVFNSGSANVVSEETLKLLNECGGYKNFFISSGCDIPPLVDFDNVNMFFKSVEWYYCIETAQDAV